MSNLAYVNHKLTAFQSFLQSRLNRALLNADSLKSTDVSAEVPPSSNGPEERDKFGTKMDKENGKRMIVYDLLIYMI